MKKTILIILYFATTSSAFGQYGKGRYQIDSLQFFSENKLTYEFNLFGPSEGLFFGKYNYSQLPNIELKIYNNSSDTIIKKYAEKDAHLMWIRMGGSCGRCDTMAPKDYFILKSGWAAWGCQPLGPFATSIKNSNPK